MKAFGFEDAVNDFDTLTRNADDAKPEVEKMAIKMRDRAKKIAVAKGLTATGAGTSGIVAEEQDDGYEVGWAQRPNFHLYFHELGFHALDNRRGKARLKRNSKGSRARIYDSGQATYVTAKPHMRPAFDELEPEYYEKVQNTLEKGV